MQVQAKIQKWGNSLGLRLSGVLRDLPDLQENTEVEIEVTQEGFSVKKIEKQMEPNKMSLKLPYTEKELLAGILSHDNYTDLLVNPLKSESAD